MDISKKGFTLVELLIVIGILAILGTITVVVLNPAQLFAQARDSQRISDMSSLTSALSLYISIATPIDMNGPGGAGTAYEGPGATDRCADRQYVAVATTANSFSAGRATAVSVNLRGVGGGSAGWLPVNFTAIAGAAPFAALPIDPTNTGDLVYRYACDGVNSTFELNAKMESDRYRSGGVSDVESNAKDGGNNAGFYEVGTDPDLNL